MRKILRLIHALVATSLAAVLIALPSRAVWVNHDSDDDGLSDCRERAGLRKHGGAATYKTDPMSADSDGDLLPDADEIGDRTFTGAQDAIRTLWDCESQTYRAVSDPARADSDFDGLSDAVELSEGTDVFVQDSDGDGLLDAAERSWGSDPNAADTDGDGFLDVEDVSGDRSPVVLDVEQDQESWLGEYTEGLYYGDARDSDTVAQLIGSLSGGSSSVVPVFGWLTGSIADARDVIANVARRQWGDAGVSSAGLLPYVGDAAKATRKTSQFVAKHPQLVGDLTRRIATWDKIPDGMRLKLLGATDPASYDAAVKTKLSDQSLVALTARGATLASIAHMINKAAGTVVSAQPNGQRVDEDGFFHSIDDAVSDLQEAVAPHNDGRGAGPIFVPPSSNSGGRLYDACTACDEGVLSVDSTLYIVKMGTQVWSPTLQHQIDNDHSLVRRGHRVEWHLYPGPTGLSVDRGLTDALSEAQVPFVVHLPE